MYNNSMYTWYSRRLLLLLFLIVFPLSHLLAQEAGETVIKRGVIIEDFYVAGGSVHVDAEVKGDVVAAGGRVKIGKLIKGDVIAAGGSVIVKGRVLDDVRAVGGEIILESEIEGDAIVAGGNVNISPETVIKGRAWLAGKYVEVSGSIGKELKAGAETVIISGQILGDVSLAARNIEILPTARIQGDLTYRSPQEAMISPEASITGNVTYIETKMRPPTPAGKTFVRVLFFLSLTVTGIVLFLLFPNFTVSSATTIRSDPWKSLGLGLALLVTTPFVVFIFMSTVIGIPLALVLFALYFISLLVGFLAASFFLGDMEIRLLYRGPELSRGLRVLSLILALIVLWLIQYIPIVGGFILFLVLLFGLGAIGIQTYRTYTGARL